MKLSYRVASAALAGVSLIGITASQSPAFAAPVAASAASASDVSPETEALVSNIKALQSQSSVLEGEQAQTWVKRVTADVSDQKVATHLKAGSSLVTERATVYKFHKGNTQVSIPFSDQERGASLNVVYDSSGKVVETLEMQLTHDDKTGHAQVWRNGALTADKTIKAADLPKDLPATQPKISTYGFSWGKLNDCLSGAGISSWALALIGTACAAACVGTAGVACVPCITAAGGVGAGTVWFCIGKATS
ncbi:hypothetical protein O1L44_02835 [Streptomyces noursei]|uniref:hypothetical protein n=1 Tax=Streptomyces noursei TaxID=1971 RepID=UPI00081CB8F9|nr:hypothetical protein SNOUR_07910 [Streptomyces noursei ATCC 11455]MCZ0992295.1 hypothetical protein [Streptomyces noursei]